MINSVGRSLGTYSYGTDDEDLRASLLRRLNPIPHTTMMFRRAEIAELGNYNPAFLRAQDVDLIHRVSEHHRIGAIGQPLCLLRFSDEGISIAPESGLEQRMYALLADAVAAYRRGTGVDVTRMPCWLEVSRAFASRFYRSGWPRRHGAWISLRHARAAFRARRPIRGLQHLLRSLWISPVAIGDRISRRDPRPDHLFWMEEAIGSLDQCEGGEAGGAS